MKYDRSEHFALKTICLATLAALSHPAIANPTGATVVNGNATFNQQGNTLNISNSNGTIINWNAFTIAPGEVTKFIQNNSSSAVLNRVTGQDPSQILGSLQSNGRVFLINPNGIVFGQGAQVDTAGLVASTLNISDADFKAGNLKFTGVNAGTIDNAAHITTPSGGFVYLIAPEVSNEGVIFSPNGEILLAAGSSVELVDGVDTSLRVKLTAPAGQVLNVGQVIAENGRIGIFGAAIEQQGIVRATSAQLGANGEVVFKATNSVDLAAGSTVSGDNILVQGSVSTTVNGTVDASNSTGQGGTATILGNAITVNGTVDASGSAGGGTIRIGGDTHGIS